MESPSSRPLSKEGSAQTTLNSHLQESQRVYGCLTELSNPELIKQLARIPCTLILQEVNWNIEPHKTNYELYSQLKPITFDYYQKLNRHLAKRKEDYPSKAVRSISNNKIYHKFLIIEKQNSVGLWIGALSLDQEGLYSQDLAVIEDFRNEFLNLLCLSGELKDSSFEPFRYYYFLEQEIDSWRVVEGKESKGEESYSTLTRVNTVLSSPSVRLAGKVLYYGLAFAVETKYPHLSIIKRIIDKWL